MLARVALGLAAVATLATGGGTTGNISRGESGTATTGLLVSLLGQLEDLRQGLALVGAHRLLHVRHPRATLAAYGFFGGGFHFCFYAREDLATKPGGSRANKFHWQPNASGVLGFAVIVFNSG